MERRDLLKSLAALPVAALPVAGRLSFDTDDEPQSSPLFDLRDRRAANQQELVVLLTPAVGHSFHPDRRREQAERLAEALAIEGRAETFIEWDHHYQGFWKDVARVQTVGRVRPRSHVVATFSPAAQLPHRVVAMADAWVCVNDDGEGVVRFIEFDPFEDEVLMRDEGRVEFD